MPLNEDQALSLLQARKVMPPEQQAQADGLLKGYRDGQEELGLPPFPNMQAQAAASVDSFRSMFTDLRNVDKQASGFPALLQNSPDPQGDRQRIANVKFFARQSGMPEEQAWDAYPVLRGAFAKQTWGVDVNDDAGFYAQAQKQVTGEVEREKRQGTAQDHALVKATNSYFDNAGSSFAEWKAQNKDADAQDMKYYLSVYNKFNNDLTGHKDTVEKLSSGLNRYMNSDGGTLPEDAVNTLLDMPARTRNTAIAALLTMAGKQGEQSDKNLVQQTGEAFSRTLVDMFGGERYKAAVLSLTEKSHALDTTTAPEGASSKDILSRAMGSVADGVSGFNLNSETGRPLTTDERVSVSNELARAKKGFQLALQVEQIARTGDPVKSALASGLGSSAALMGIIALPGGSAVSAMGYANTEYKQLRLEHPEMSEGAAQGVSLVSGGIQAGLDKLEFDFIAHKLPSLADLMAKGVGAGAIPRALLRGVETFTFEQFQEGAQDITTAVVQDVASKLSSDVPQVDWKSEWADWWKQRPDVAIGTLPLTLVGMGVAHVHDVKGAEAMLTHNHELAMQGVQESDRASIIEPAVAGDMDTAEKALQDAFHRRDPEIAKAAGASVEKVNELEAFKEFQKLVDKGIMPQVTATNDGFVVATNDGKSQTVKTWDEAKALSEQHFADLQNKDIDLVAQMAAHFTGQSREGVNESVTINPETRTTAQDTQEHVVSPDDARTAAVQAGMAVGMNEEDAVKSMTAVLGRNITDTRGLIAQSATALFRGANALTVTEEIIHGRWDAGLASGRYTEEQGREWVKQAEDATGHTFLHGPTALDLKEAISSIVNADVLGRRMKGDSTTLDNSPAGLVTKSMLDAISRQAADKSFVGFLGAFRQFFKQVFSAARALRIARIDGNLDQNFQSFLDDLLGVSKMDKTANAAAVEAADMAGLGKVAYSLAPGSFTANARHAELEAKHKAGTITAKETEEAQRLVDTAAKKAGYEPEPIFHGSRQKFNEFKKGDLGFHFGKTIDQVIGPESRFSNTPENQVNIIKGYSNINNPIRLFDHGSWSGERVVDEINQKAGLKIPKDAGYKEITDALKKSGYDGVSYENLHEGPEGSEALIAFDPSQIKSAEPFTGVPLSERFNPKSNSIAYALAPAAFHQRIEGELSKFLKDPAKRIAFVREAMSRVRNTGNLIQREGIMARGDVHLASERADPEGKSYESLVKASEKMAAQEKAALIAGGMKEKQAGVKSATSATKWLQGQVDAFMLGTTAWTEKAHAYLRKEAYTREGFEYDRLLKKHFGADTAEKQAALPSSDRAAARSEARTEAQRWLKDELAKLPTPEERHHNALRVLDAAAMAFPPEMRSKFGGYAEWNKARTDEARVKLLQRKLEKVDAAIESELKSHYTEQITKLLKSGKPDYSPGDMPKSSIGPDAAHLFDAAFKASKMDEAQVLTELAKLDAAIASGKLTSEQEDLAVAESNLIERVGNIKNQDAATLETGLAMLKDIHDNGSFSWMLEHGARQAALQKTVEEFRAGTGKDGLATERSDARDFADTRFGIGRNVFLRLSSYSEVLHYMLGNNAELARQLVNQERNASNAYHDASNHMEQVLEDFFTREAGGVVDGQQLRWDMAQRNIDAGKAGKLSQLQAIQAMLMWAQPEGRKHMEGVFDEHGTQVSKWAYDQAWIDDLAKNMTPTADRLMQFISNEYGKEWASLNEKYRERFGVDMPKVDRYAPITVVPHTISSKGTVVDPVTGAEMSGNVTHPGFLRSRSKQAVAEPNFKDALQVFVGHKRQVEYWLSHYDVAKQLERLAYDRETRNTIEAVAGAEGVRVFEDWSAVISQGGFRDSTAASEVNKVLSKMIGNASSAAILGRLSTLVVQASQLGAGMVQMPLGAFMSRIGKGMSGELDLANTFKSPFIQRRIDTMSPLVRQAVSTLATAKPNVLRHQIHNLGMLLGGADALFTTFTYASILDYQREQLASAGLKGAELDRAAHSEAERLTEEVAQPVRNTTRSLYELQTRNPLARAMWAFASESRQKVALTAWALGNHDTDGGRAVKAAFLTFVVNGLFNQVFKNAWREAKGDDDERKWGWAAMLRGTILSPLGGIPGVSAFTDTGSLFSGPERSAGAFKRLVTGEDSFDLKALSDVEMILQGAALFNEDAAALSALSHAGVDAAKLLGNLANSK